MRRTPMESACPHPRRVRVERWPIAGAVHDQPRRQDRSRRWWSPNSPTAAIAAAANACPMRATARPSTACAAAIGAMAAESAQRPRSRAALQTAMPAGAARNALDCAFWDLAGQARGQPVHELAGLAAPQRAHHRLHDLARHAGGDGAGRRARPPTARCSRSSSAARGDPARIARGAARAAPRAELIVDANEGWTAGRSRARTSPPARKPASRWSSSRCRPDADDGAGARSRGRSRSAPTRACMTARRSPRSSANTTRSTSSSTRPAG